MVDNIIGNATQRFELVENTTKNNVNFEILSAADVSYEHATILPSTGGVWDPMTWVWFASFVGAIGYAVKMYFTWKEVEVREDYYRD